MQPSNAAAAAKLTDTEHEIRGYDLNNGLDYEKLLKSYLNTGFQATNFGKAVNEINRMVYYIYFFFFLFLSLICQLKILD